jgi:hypothetical protein
MTPDIASLHELGPHRRGFVPIIGAPTEGHFVRLLTSCAASEGSPRLLTDPQTPSFLRGQARPTFVVRCMRLVAELDLRGSPRSRRQDCCGAVPMPRVKQKDPSAKTCKGQMSVGWSIIFQLDELGSKGLLSLVGVTPMPLCAITPRGKLEESQRPEMRRPCYRTPWEKQRKRACGFCCSEVEIDVWPMNDGLTPNTITTETRDTCVPRCHMTNARSPSKMARC